MPSPVRTTLAVFLIAGSVWVSYQVWSGTVGEGHGTLHRHTITASVSVADRAVSVWVPPGYDTLRTDGYPVLYMQDGERLFRPDETGAPDWQVDETLGTAIEAGQLPPVIVVGIHSTDRRLREYLPTTPFYLQPDSLWQPFRRQRGRPLGDEYMQHIYEDVIPFVHQTYHTTSDPSRMFIAGPDVAGVFALYAAAKMPFAFGGAAALSPDWTPGRATADTAFVTAFRDYWAGQREALRSVRLYVDRPPEPSNRAFAAHQQIIGSFLHTYDFPRQQWALRSIEASQRDRAAHGRRLKAAVRFLLDAPRTHSDPFFTPPALRDD